MEDKVAEIFRSLRNQAAAYCTALVKWLVLAIIVGVLSGVVGSLFHHGVDHVTELRGEYPWLIYLLPLAGLVIVALYKGTKTEGQGTNDIFDAVRQGKPVKFLLLPAIFFGTIITHFFCGSAGREGAAREQVCTYCPICHFEFYYFEQASAPLCITPDTLLLGDAPLCPPCRIAAASPERRSQRAPPTALLA